MSRRRTRSGARGTRAREAMRRRRRILALALGAALCAALVLSSLRLEIFRLRYALAESLREEEALLERRNALEIDVARLRDPRRLRDIAKQRGFGLPERVILLDPPAEPEERRP